MNTLLHNIIYLLIIPVLFTASYSYLKPRFTEWSEPERGFQVLETRWKKIFTVNGIIATGIAVMLLTFTQASLATSISVALVSGFLLIGAYSDLLTSRVPIEVSNLTFWVALTFGSTALIINSFNIGNQQKFYSTIPLIINDEISWYYVLGGVVALLVGFLIWRRAYGVIGLVASLVAFVGLWLAIYVGLVSLSGWLTTSFPEVDSDVWRNLFVFGLSSILIVLCVTAAFDLGTYDKMGGADSAAMYAAGWGFAAIVGGVNIGIGVMVGAVLQLILHLFAKPLGLPGRKKTVKNDPIKQYFVNSAWKKNNKTGSAPTTHTAVALPFLPMLNVSVIVTVLTVLIVY